MTGQILTRNDGENDGRTRVLLGGVVAVPQVHASQWQHDQQYPVLACNPRQRTRVLDRGSDRSDEVHGMRADALLAAPIWRV